MVTPTFADYVELLFTLLNAFGNMRRLARIAGGRLSTSIRP